MITKLILFFIMSMMTSWGKPTDNSVTLWRIVSSNYGYDVSEYLVAPENLKSLEIIASDIVMPKEDDPIASHNLYFSGHSSEFLMRYQDEYYLLQSLLFVKGVFGLTKIKALNIRLNGALFLDTDSGVKSTYFYDPKLHDLIINNLESVKKYRESRIDYIKTEINPNFKEPAYRKDRK